MIGKSLTKSHECLGDGNLFFWQQGSVSVVPTRVPPECMSVCNQFGSNDPLHSCYPHCLAFLPPSLNSMWELALLVLEGQQHSTRGKQARTHTHTHTHTRLVCPQWVAMSASRWVWWDPRVKSACRHATEPQKPLHDRIRKKMTEKMQNSHPGWARNTKKKRKKYKFWRILGHFPIFAYFRGPTGAGAYFLNSGVFGLCSRSAGTQA